MSQDRSAESGAAPVWHRPMVARDRTQPHRTATPLELLFDLVYVVAVAQAASGLHHAFAEDHVDSGVLRYAMVFFAIWWAWMNFTWFASAYDTNDIPYRLAVFVQMSGALVLAAGVPRAMNRGDLAIATLGYVIMRLAAVPQWLRAAHSDPARRASCLRFAVGITVVQICWVARLSLPDGWQTPGFAVLCVAELLVPIIAEHAEPTTWHPHHIAERYGLFTIIVLGESILAASRAIQSALDADVAFGDLVTTAGGGLLIVLSMWWLYFAKPAERLFRSLRASLTWGYGHYFIFGSAAAVGSGLVLTVDHTTGTAHVSERLAAGALTVPVAVYVLTVWVLHLRPHHTGLLHGSAFPAAALLVLAATFTGQAVLITGLILVATVAVTVVIAMRVLGGRQPSR
jgi:low temperature requirement protein LtrA